MNLPEIRQRLDAERRHLVRTSETITELPHLTRLQIATQYNVIFSSLTPQNADEAIAGEIAHHRELGVPFEWKVYGYDPPADLVQRLERHGFTIGPNEAVMVFDLLTADLPHSPAGECAVARIDRPEQLPDFRRVAEEVFAKNYDFTVNQLTEALAAGSTEHRAYVAYVGNEPASCGRLYTHPNSAFAGFYGGGTRKAFRGRGVYRALVAARAHDAIALGARYLLVDALPTSRPILERLGLERLTDTWPCEWSPDAAKS